MSRALLSSIRFQSSAPAILAAILFAAAPVSSCADVASPSIPTTQSTTSAAHPYWIWKLYAIFGSHNNTGDSNNYWVSEQKARQKIELMGITYSIPSFV